MESNFSFNHFIYMKSYVVFNWSRFVKVYQLPEMILKPSQNCAI